MDSGDRLGALTLAPHALPLSPLCGQAAKSQAVMRTNFLILNIICQDAEEALDYNKDDDDLIDFLVAAKELEVHIELMWSSGTIRAGLILFRSFVSSLACLCFVFSP